MQISISSKNVLKYLHKSSKILSLHAKLSHVALFCLVHFLGYFSKVYSIEVLALQQVVQAVLCTE